MTNASLAGLSLLFSLPLYLHQVLIYGTYVLFQLRHFWNGLERERAFKNLYKASIVGMRLRLPELQDEDKQARKLSADQQLGQQSWDDIDGVWQH